MRHLLLTLISLWTCLTLADTQLPGGLNFRADFYQRDLTKNTIKGRGKAWLKQEGYEVWADEIEIDMTLNRAFANGNVRIKESNADIYCDRGNYSLDGKDATLENGTIISGQMVYSGISIRKLGPDRFDMEEGIYTNCNTDPVRDRTAGSCPYDIKIYGRRFSLTLEEYVTILDGIVYAKELPVLYTPFFMAPAKTKRTTGLLMPSLTYRDHLGTAFNIPFFWAISSWQDLTISPSFWSKAGHHLGLEYNYAYSGSKNGTARFFFSKYPFGSNLAEPWVRAPDVKYGFFSEGAVDIHNIYSLGGRAHSRQDIRWVSHKYFHRDYPDDFGPSTDLGYLRSQVVATLPSDNTLLVGSFKAHQSLISTLDEGIDNGGVQQLPDIRFFRKNTETPFKYLTYEFTSRITNYFRGQSAFDNVPTVRSAPPDSSTEDLNYDSNDYIRTGRRLIIEPRLIGNVPLASGFQLQPLLRAGALVYHFDLPQSEFISQRYADIEIPFSLYMSRTFEPGISGFEKIRHVIQPRVMYVSSLYRSPAPSSKFFMKDDLPGFTNPRFDLLDQNEESEFMQFEFNNRFLRPASGSMERFLLLQLTNKYYLKPSIFNNRLAGLGPLELLLDLKLGDFAAQVQGSYQLQSQDDVHENDWSAGVTYNHPRGDKITLNTVFRHRRNSANNEATVVLSAYKTLPVFLDITGSIERSFKDNNIRAYEVGFVFRNKPSHCWSLSMVSGRTVGINETYAKFLFGLNFGGPATLTTPGG